MKNMRLDILKVCGCKLEDSIAYFIPIYYITNKLVRLIVFKKFVKVKFQVHTYTVIAQI